VAQPDPQVLPDAIVDALRRSILDHRSILDQGFNPGDPVTEAAVSARFGVARPTARTAIDKLVHDGLLERAPHRAARIPRLTAGDVEDLFDNRALLESAAMAALARAGAIPADALAAHRRLGGADDAFAVADIAFHRAMVAGQPSRRLAAMHARLMGEVELCIGQVQVHHLLRPADVLAQHQQILDAVIAGDADAAAAAARHHITTARTALLTHYQTRSSAEPGSTERARSHTR
jgi:DNA-binding GntR family transcriptional regulator